MSITIGYELSEAAQRAALLARDNAQKRQHVEVPPDHPRYAEALSLAKLDDKGDGIVVHVNIQQNSSSYGKHWDSRPDLRLTIWEHLPTIDELLDDEQHHRSEIEVLRTALEVEQLQQREAQMAEMLAAGPEGMVETYYRYPVGSRWRVKSCEWKNDPCFTKLLFHAEALADARNAEADQADQAAKAANAAKEAEQAAEIAAWIEAHGSPRLKRMVAEGIEYRATLHDERLALERPGWRWSAKAAGSYDAPRNPPSSAFDLLDEGRKVDPAARLVYWKADAEYDEYGDEISPEWQGYVVLANYFDAEIMFGGPED